MPSFVFAAVVVRGGVEVSDAEFESALLKGGWLRAPVFLVERRLSRAAEPETGTLTPVRPARAGVCISDDAAESSGARGDDFCSAVTSALLCPRQRN